MPILNEKLFPEDEPDDDEDLELEPPVRSDLVFKPMYDGYVGPGSLSPGDIVQLVYQGSGRKTLLISSSDRAPDGKFVSTRGKDLLCCFEVNPTSFSFKLILKFLHKNKKRCNYYAVPGFLKYVLGLKSFKTLDFIKIYYVSLLINKGKK